jgi:hypothetical protein
MATLKCLLALRSSRNYRLGSSHCPVL